MKQETTTNFQKCFSYPLITKQNIIINLQKYFNYSPIAKQKTRIDFQEYDNYSVVLSKIYISKSQYYFKKHKFHKCSQCFNREYRLKPTPSPKLQIHLQRQEQAKPNCGSITCAVTYQAKTLFSLYSPSHIF